jgi:hypothetical protein
MTALIRILVLLWHLTKSIYVLLMGIGGVVPDVVGKAEYNFAYLIVVLNKLFPRF